MRRTLSRIVMGAGLAVMIAVLYVPLSGHSVWTLGDVFVGVGSGNFKVVNNAGEVVDNNLAAGSTGDTTGGCALDASLNAYLVNTTQQTIFRYSPAQVTSGPPPRPHVSLASIATADSNPQSIAFAPDGSFFVGHLGGLIRRYAKNSSGVYVAAQSHQATADTSDSFSLDIAADGTIFYASGGRNIRRVPFDGSAFGSDTPFTTLPVPNSQAARALRVLPPTIGGGNAAVLAGLIVADKTNVKWVNAAGAVIGQYDAGSGSTSQDDWFAIALDPSDVDDGGTDRAFWAGDKSSGQLWKFNVQSGFGTIAAPQLGPVSTGGVGTLRGACINGEPTAGQYTVVLKFDDANNFKATATFADGTSDEHRFGIELNCTVAPFPCVSGSTVTAVVNAREVISDAVCTGNSELNTSDVDCGFKKYFSPPNATDPALPFGARYVHGRAVYYRVTSWANGLGNPITKPQISMTISSEAQLPQVPNCTATIPRALRVFRDPSETDEDQFAEDLTDFLGIDEWLLGGRANRFMIAGRCATGSSAFKAPAQGRTFKAGNSIPIDLILTDKDGIPISNATLAPHSIATTVGFSGGISFFLGTPGNSADFWRLVQPGKYSGNLDTTGLLPSSLPYNLCVSDKIDSTDPSVDNQQPLYQHNCLTFFLK